MPRPRPPIVLAYHGVADVPLSGDPHGLFVAPREVRRQIAALRRWGYAFSTFGELVASAGRGRASGLAALTFDDGYADNLHALAPLLAGEGVPATVFVVSGWLGGVHPVAPSAPILTAAQVRELHAAGVEIGGHTHSHPDLVAAGPDEALRELARGRGELEAVIDAPVRSIAYPFGRADAAVRAAARAAGFVAGCRTSGQGRWDDPLDIPRQDMTNRSSLLGLRLKRAGRYERLVATPAGRAARRLRRTAIARIG